MPPANPPRRAVFTGTGALSPVGNTVPETWAAIKAGKSGIGPVTLFDISAYASRIGGEVKGFDPAKHMDRKDVRRTDRFAQFAVVASLEAVAEAKLDMAGEDPDRVGVVVGSGIGGFTTLQEQHGTHVLKGPDRVSPFVIPMLIINMASGLVSIRLGARGPNTGVVTACASGTHALGEAFRTIERGDADVMIAGGADATVTPFGYAGFCNMGALSTRNDAGPAASCPFDARRDGFVMGEGAGMVVMESLEHAKARGARILGEIVGYGATGDGYHMTAPEPEGKGATAAMRRAIADAGLKPEQIDYINAHGTSTQLNDKTETLAIKNVFGGHARKLLISSSKSMTGHMLGAAGAVEAIISLMTMIDGFVPPTINYEVPDPACDLEYVPNKGVAKEVNISMSNSFGFGGHNAVVVLKKWTN